MVFNVLFTLTNKLRKYWDARPPHSRASSQEFTRTLLVCAGKPGRWVFRSSKRQCEHGQPSYDFQCRQWAVQQKKRYDNGRHFTRQLPPCPCFLWQAQLDPRYYVDRAINCAVLAFPVISTTIAQVRLA